MNWRFKTVYQYSVFSYLSVLRRIFVYYRGIYSLIVYVLFLLYTLCKRLAASTIYFQRFPSSESSILADFTILIKSFFTRSITQAIHLCLGLFPTGLLVKTLLMKSCFARHALNSFRYKTILDVWSVELFSNVRFFHIVICSYFRYLGFLYLSIYFSQNLFFEFQ